MDHEQVYLFQCFFEIGSKFFLPIFFAAGSCLATSFGFYYPLLLVLGPDCCLQLHLRKRILHSFTLIQYGFLSLKLKNSFQRSRLMMAHFASKWFIGYFVQVLPFNSGYNLFKVPQILGFVQVAECLLNPYFSQLFIFFIAFPLKNRLLDLQ